MVRGAADARAGVDNSAARRKAISRDLPDLGFYFAALSRKVVFVEKQITNLPGRGSREGEP